MGGVGLRGSRRTRRGVAGLLALAAVAVVALPAVAAPPATAPPDTSITDALVQPGSATFEFTGTDATPGPPKLKFRCRLDGGSFKPCKSPKVYTGLAPGSHTFAVFAVDKRHTVDPTPATFTWTAAPDHASADVPDGGVVSTGTVATPSDTTVSSVENRSGQTQTITLDEFNAPPAAFCDGFTDCVGQVVDAVAGETPSAVQASTGDDDPVADYDYRMSFRFDASVVAGRYLSTFKLIHDDHVVPNCTPALRAQGIECVVARKKLADGDFVLVADSPENGRIRGR